MHTMRCAYHAPFRCPRAHRNGGRGKPNWARIEYKLAKQESRQPDLRWGPDAVQLPTESPVQSKRPSTTMMHGIPSRAASSWQGAAFPSIHEHRPWAPMATKEEVILPKPSYRVDASLWHLNIMERALVQDQWHLSCATSIPWRVQTIQVISMVVLSQLTTFVNFEGEHPLRTSPNSSVISKGSSLSPRLFVCSPMASKIRS